MTKVIIVFVVLYLFFYIRQILNWSHKMSQFDHLLPKFSNIFKEISDVPPYNVYEDANVRDLILDQLFKENPLISALIPYSYRSFSLTDDAETVYFKFLDQHDLLQKEYNRMIFKRLSIFNPINPLKEIFLIPSKVLNWFGMNLDEIPSRVISLASYLIGIVLTNYGKEILNWIVRLF